jgi:TetR/AcrR family transcriptional regulator, cholesterol catabolism regulator
MAVAGTNLQLPRTTNALLTHRMRSRKLEVCLTRSFSGMIILTNVRMSVRTFEIQRRALYPNSMSTRKSPHYDRKLEAILRHSAAMFCEHGYHQASMRDISRATGVSLAGLYYYCSSKEHLLYLIQRHTFESILDRSRAALEGGRDPEKRLRIFVRMHLRYLLAHPSEMKVINHEAASLEDERRREVSALKKAYYRLCFEQVDALRQSRKLVGFNSRIAVLSLFGMMNWIYTWYNPKVDPQAEAIAGQMIDLFLNGLTGFRSRRKTETKSSRPIELAPVVITAAKVPSNGAGRSVTARAKA